MDCYIRTRPQITRVNSTSFVAMMRSAQQALTKRTIIHGTHIPDDIPAPQDPKDRITIFLHKQLYQVIDQEQQPGCSKHKREQLKVLHQQIL